MTVENPGRETIPSMTRRLIRYAAMALFVTVLTALAGCGQKGPLFLPVPLEEVETEASEQNEDEEEQGQQGPSN